jgi:hypothetical protein
MGHDPDEAAQDLIAQTVCRGPVKNRLEPMPILGVPGDVLAVCVDEDVHVGQHHRSALLVHQVEQRRAVVQIHTGLDPVAAVGGQRFPDPSR